MTDIDEILTRTYSDVAGGGTPTSNRLARVLREGRRRRHRHQLIAGGSAATLVVAALAGMLALRPGRSGDGGREHPADSTTGLTVPDATPGSTPSPTTVPGPTSPSAPGVIGSTAPTPGSPAPAAAANADVAFVAVATTGRIEAWARLGLVRTVEGCADTAPAEQCRVVATAVGGGKVWFVQSVGSPQRTRLFAAPLAKAVAASLIATAPAGESWGGLSVTADGTEVYLTTDGATPVAAVPGPVVRLRGVDRTTVGARVTSVALSGDGRLAYAELTETGLGTMVIRTLADGGERRVALEAGVGVPSPGDIRSIEWSPDRRRLLLSVDPLGTGTWATLDLDGPTKLVRQSKLTFGPACWTGDETLAMGAWQVGKDTIGAGPLVRFDVVRVSDLGTYGDSFSGGREMVCRTDGAVAFVADPSPFAPGELYVVNGQGVATRLGIGYASVARPGWGAVPITAPVVSPASTSSTSAGSRAPVTANADAFAATTAASALEVWSPKGKVLTIAVPVSACLDNTCGSGDRVSAVAITERSVWFAGAFDGSLWRAPLDGSPPVLVTMVDGTITDLAVSRDDATTWFVRTRRDGFAALERRRNGATTPVAPDARAVALSPDGARLAYTTYAFTSPASLSRELVVRDLASGAERRVPWNGGGVSPSALDDLRWSPDGTRLLVGASWEGTRDFVVAADLPATLDTPAYLASGSLNARSCWIDATTVARGLWTLVYADGVSKPGDVVAGNVGTGLQTPYGASVYGNELACRSDGAVALVDRGTMYEQPGDLVVVRPGGVRTVLGRGYLAVFPG